LTADDAATCDQFGASVVISGDVAVLGAPFNNDVGAVYAFRSFDGGTTWAQVAKLTASDAAADDEFHYSVGIDGSLAVIGARFDDEGSFFENSGAAYVFKTTDSGVSWAEVDKLTTSDGFAFDNLGFSVSIDGSLVVVGSPFTDDPCHSGSAFVFGPPVCL